FRQHTLFFFWGAILVIVLFGLGHVCADAVQRIGRSGASFPALLRRLAKNRDRFAVASEAAEGSAARLRKELDEARARLQAASEESSSILGRITQLQTELPQIAPDAPSLHRLTPAEVHHFKNLGCLWLLLCIVSCFATLGLT